MDGTAAPAPSAPVDSGTAPPSSGETSSSETSDSSEPRKGMESHQSSESKSEPTEKKEDAPKVDAKADAKSEPADKAPPPDSLTFKINGEEVTKTREEWLKRAQKSYAADKRFEEAARIRKEADAAQQRALKILNQAKSDPLSLINAMGEGTLEQTLINLVHSQGPARDALAKALNYALEDSKKPEHVRQAEAIERQRKQFVERQERERQRMTQARNNEVFQALTPHYQRLAVAAMEKAGFPTEGPHARRFAEDLLMSATRTLGEWRDGAKFHEMDFDTYGQHIQSIRQHGINGLDKMVNRLVEDLVQQRDGHVQAFLSSADAERLAEALGEEGIAKVKEHLRGKAAAAKEAKAKEALKPPKDVPQRAPKEPEKPKIMDLEDILEAKRLKRSQGR